MTRPQPLLISGNKLLRPEPGNGWSNNPITTSWRLWRWCSNLSLRLIIILFFWRALRALTACCQFLLLQKCRSIFLKLQILANNIATDIFCTTEPFRTYFKQLMAHERDTSVILRMLNVLALLLVPIIRQDIQKIRGYSSFVT